MAAASSGQPPPGTGPPPAPGNNTNTPITGAENTQSSGTNYASMAAATSESKWLHLHLHREEKSISFNLTKKEKAVLLFRRFKLDPKSVISIESCDFEQIRIELKPWVDVEKLKTSTAIQIRPGLKVQPMKELKRTTRVKVCWVKLSVPDEEIVKTLELFGKVEGRVEHLTFEINEEESKDGDLHQLKGIKSGERAVEIELARNIPSYVKIAGKRARIWYPGQNFTCGRCYKSFRSCPGKADRRECLRLKGKERDFEEFWKEIVAVVPRREAMAPDDKYDTDTLDLARVPEAVTKQELLDWIKSKQINMEPEVLQPTQFKNTWKITEIPSEGVMEEMIKRLHGAKIRNKAILALPIKMPTPNKTQHFDMEPGGEVDDPNMEVGENMSSGLEKQKEKEAEKEEDERLRKAAEKSGEDEKKRIQQELDQQQRDRDQQQQERDQQQQAGQGSDQGRAAAGSSAGPSVPGKEGEATHNQTADKPNTRVSNIFTSTARNLGETFGLLSKKGPIIVESKSKSSAPQATSAPAQTKPNPEPDKIKPPAETGTRPKQQQVLAEETPAQAPPVTNKNFVKETPLNLDPASPILSRSNRSKEEDNGDLTVDSNDEIFTSVIDITKTPTFKSNWGQYVHTMDKRERNHSINLNSKRDHRWVSSSESSYQESIEKPKPKIVEEPSKKGPVTPKQVDKEGYEKPLTKGQKKAQRKKAKKDEKKKKLEEAEEPSAGDEQW